MRIISGKFKGKKIIQPEDRLTRPLKDLTKESIFNIRHHSNIIDVKIENSNILDLFSGVGSFGLECISRGAANIIFYENYKNVLKILKKNIINLDCHKNTKIIELNAFNQNAFDFINIKFEIIFIDPPYKKKDLSLILSNIYKMNILKKNGIIIIHRHKEEKDKFPDRFNVILEKTYGISKIIFGN